MLTKSQKTVKDLQDKGNSLDRDVFYVFGIEYHNSLKNFFSNKILIFLTTKLISGYKHGIIDHVASSSRFTKDLMVERFEGKDCYRLQLMEANRKLGFVLNDAIDRFKFLDATIWYAPLGKVDKKLSYEYDKYLKTLNYSETGAFLVGLLRIKFFYKMFSFFGFSKDVLDKARQKYCSWAVPNRAKMMGLLPDNFDVHNHTPQSFCNYLKDKGLLKKYWSSSDY